MVKRRDEKLTRAQYQAKKKRRHFWRPFAVSKVKKKRANYENEPTIITIGDEPVTDSAELNREEKIRLIKRRLNIGIFVTASLIVVVLLILFLVK